MKAYFRPPIFALAGFGTKSFRYQTDQLRAYKLFRGHFLGYLEPFLGMTLRKFTVLRDPLDRTISHYYHVRRAPDHPFHHLSRQLDIGDFCLNPITRHTVENYQAAYLSTICLTPWGCSRRAGPGSALQTMVERGSGQSKSNDWLLNVAEDALSRFESVGTTDRLDDSLQMFADKLRLLNHPVRAAHINAGSNRLKTSDIDPHSLDIIRELTAVDQQLYNSAARQLNHWKKLHGGVGDMLCDAIVPVKS